MMIRVSQCTEGIMVARRVGGLRTGRGVGPRDGYRVPPVRTWCIVLGLLTACGGDDVVVDSGPQLPAWEKRLPPATELGARRGLTPARGIVHLHSPFSHDACDGKPRDATGVPNEPCLLDLRAALCATRIDFAALTDHDDSMADETFSALFSMRGTDEPIMRGADQIGSRMRCDDGHEVAFTVGGENDLMPIMLDRHPPGTVEERHATYNGNDVASATAFRDAGGLVWLAHTESQPLERMRAIQPDGIEVYNLHANLDPDIRKDYLGLPAAGAIQEALIFADSNPGHPEPDLALLSFLSPNQVAIDKWQTLLAEGQRIAVTAGSDAHQNALPVLLPDGERGDSYRRVLRWFGNIALVSDPKNVDEIQNAFAAGRNFVVFEMLGTPVGFDASARTASGTVVEIGGSLQVADGAVLTVELPTVLGLDTALPAPTIMAKVIRIAPSGAPVVVAEGDSTLTANLDAPGAYRIEVTIVPSHLGPYLGDLGPAKAEQTLPWIYTSPFYVQ